MLHRINEGNLFTEWLLINVHLIPSTLCFYLGAILLVLAPVSYQIRKRKLIILNPIKAIREYSPLEKRLLIIGAALLFFGLLSMFVIEKFWGYYYFEDGMPVHISEPRN